MIAIFFRNLFRDLVRQPLRTVLTLSGVVWGTFSVILLLAFGVSVSRAQAKRFWEETLLFATAPHDAVRQLYGLIDEPEFTLRNPRWMTTVFYRGYGVWKATPVRDATAILDPYWREKIDREHQFGMAFAQTTRMLRDENPRGVVFVWFGTEHDGMERLETAIRTLQSLLAQREPIDRITPEDLEPTLKGLDDIEHELKAMLSIPN